MNNNESKIMNKLQAEIKAAMLTKDPVKRDCLRGIVSEIKNQTVNAGKEISDDVCLKVLQKAKKQREDSIACFEAAGRNDLIIKEKYELDCLSDYLPKMLSEDETKEIIKETIQKLMATNNLDISLTDRIWPFSDIHDEISNLIKTNRGNLMKSFSQNVDKKLASKLINELI
jgi:uncharacterized protein